MKQYLSNTTVQVGGISPGNKKVLFFNITLSFVQAGEICLGYSVGSVEDEATKYFMEIDNVCPDIMFSDLPNSKYVLPSAEIKEEDIEAFKLAMFTKHMNDSTPYGLNFAGLTLVDPNNAW